MCQIMPDRPDDVHPLARAELIAAINDALRFLEQDKAALAAGCLHGALLILEPERDQQ